MILTMLHRRAAGKVRNGGVELGLVLLAWRLVWGGAMPSTIFMTGGQIRGALIAVLCEFLACRPQLTVP